MKTYKEITERILTRRDEYEEAKKAKTKRMLGISSAVGCFALAAVTITVWNNTLPGNGISTDDLLTPVHDLLTETTDGNSDPATVPPSTETIVPDKITTMYNAPNQPYDIPYSTDGEVVGGWCIPCLPFERTIMISCEIITDAEAKEYFDKNAESILAGLYASGMTSDNVRISEKGYSHVCYDGTAGKSFELRRDYRDYLVYSGDRLTAIITLFKDENGNIYNTPSYGAKWFDGYNNYLQSHKGEELVYAYAGWFEIIIAPDNTYWNPMGLDASQYLEGIENPYDIFYHEAAVYIP